MGLEAGRVRQAPDEVVILDVDGQEAKVIVAWSTRRDDVGFDLFGQLAGEKGVDQFDVLDHVAQEGLVVEDGVPTTEYDDRTAIDGRRDRVASDQVAQDRSFADDVLGHGARGEPAQTPEQDWR